MVERITSKKEFNDEVLGSIPSSGTTFLFILIFKDHSYLFSTNPLIQAISNRSQRKDSGNNTFETLSCRALRTDCWDATTFGEVLRILLLVLDGVLGDNCGAFNQD